jgi:molybdopterin-guanine dinucleotide biosynthesis protein A
MGQDKALMPFLGEPLISRLIRRLAHLADELLITTNNPQDYEFTGLRLVPDLIPGAGALGGLYTALASAAHPIAAVAACDLPFASPALFEFLYARLRDGDVDAVVPVSLEGLYEPFHAVYRREVCLPAVKTALDAGQHKLISWFPQVNVELIQPEIWRPLDPEGMAFINVNTPEEFKEAEEIAARIEGG